MRARAVSRRIWPRRWPFLAVEEAGKTLPSNCQPLMCEPSLGEKRAPGRLTGLDARESEVVRLVDVDVTVHDLELFF
jgi:hypothetical protein